jgi:purine-nucleoside phosphorylase
VDSLEQEGKVMTDWRENLQETLSFIRARSGLIPSIGVILGSGLGSCLSGMAVESSFSYSDMPYFPAPTVEGHLGKLVLGRTFNRNMAVMRGRIHYYEGRPIEDVVYPVRIMQALGVEAVIVTNASGAVNSDYSPGDIMLICDHINYMGVNPLIGQAVPEGTERFTDMTGCYDAEYIRLVEQVSSEAGIRLRKGIIMAFSGPNYETAAEIAMARVIGADAVTMSTVPEVMVARQLGVKVLGLSCVTNHAAGVSEVPVEHSQVLQVAGAAAEKLDTLFSLILPYLP